MAKNLSESRCDMYAMTTLGNEGRTGEQGGMMLRQTGGTRMRSLPHLHQAGTSTDATTRRAWQPFIRALANAFRLSY